MWGFIARLRRRSRSGRASARSLHFICASLLVAFVVVHLVMVLVSGVWTNLRSMVTGRYAIDDGAAR